MPENIKIKSENEQIKQTKKIYCFFKIVNQIFFTIREHIFLIHNQILNYLSFGELSKFSN